MKFLSLTRWHASCQKFLLVILIICLPGLHALAQSQDPPQISVVSTASNLPVVAPESMASIRGTSLAAETAYVDLAGRDPSEELPTTLGGVRVQVNGEFASLLLVSPTQINFVVPSAISPGVASVSVLSVESDLILESTVTVQRIAPGLFTRDLSGKGAGFILNAATYAEAPFPVHTEENLDPDNRTRLLIYGTGLRMAGRDENGTSGSDFTKVVTVRGVDVRGRLVDLAVERATIVADSPGVDEIRVVLAPELEDAGTITLAIGVLGSSSNKVTVDIMRAAPPRILSFAPTAAPPGAEIEIQGASFIPESLAVSTGRNMVILVTTQGAEIDIVPSRITGSTMNVLIPPVVVGNDQPWFAGEVRLCVDVDRRRSCSESGMRIEPQIKSADLPGTLVLSHAKTLLDESVEIAKRLGNPDLAELIRADGEARLSRLRRDIELARAGTPSAITVAGPDGLPVTAAFSLKAIEDIESLLSGRIESFERPTVSQTSWYELPQINELSCGLAQEMQLWRSGVQYGSLLDHQRYLIAPTLGLVVALAVKECGKPPWGACLITLIPKLATIAEAYTAISMGVYAAQMALEAKPIFLTRIGVVPSTLITDVGSSKSFLVEGNFAPISPWASWRRLFERVLSSSVGAWVPAQLDGWLVDLLMTKLMDEIDKGNFPNPPSTAPPLTTELGAASLVVSPPSRPEAELRLACLDGSSSQVTALQPTPPTGVKFRFNPRPGFHLLHEAYDSPAAELTVSSTYPLRLSSHTLSPTSVIGGVANPPVIGTVRLQYPAPKDGAQVWLRSSNPNVATPDMVAEVRDGDTEGTYRVNTTAVSAVTQVSIEAALHQQQPISATLTINPQPRSFSLSLTASSVVGGNNVSATVSLGSPVTTATVIPIRSNSSLATVPAQVTIEPGRSSVSFLIWTSGVNSTETATITATHNSAQATALLTITPIPPATLSTFAISPGSVIGGLPAFGQISLTGAPPAAGSWIDFTSSDPGVAMVQSRVFIQAPSTSGQVTINTQTVPSARTVTITAAYSGSTLSASLTILPQGTVTLSDFTISPSSVVGGTALTGTLRFAGLTPSGGVTVQVTSSHPALVPSISVPVPGSADFAQFVMTTNLAQATQVVTLTASYGGASKSASVTLNPAAPAGVTLVSFALSPSSVVGGTAVTGTLQFTGLTPSDGIEVQVTSSHPSIVPPLSVSVPGSATSREFDITVNTTQTSQVVTLTASFGGAIRTAMVTVNPTEAPSAPPFVSTMHAGAVKFGGGFYHYATVEVISGCEEISKSFDDAEFSVNKSAGANSATVTLQVATSTTPRTFSSGYHNGNSLRLYARGPVGTPFHLEWNWSGNVSAAAASVYESTGFTAYAGGFGSSDIAATAKAAGASESKSGNEAGFIEGMTQGETIACFGQVYSLAGAFDFKAVVSSGGNDQPQTGNASATSTIHVTGRLVQQGQQQPTTHRNILTHPTLPY